MAESMLYSFVRGDKESHGGVIDGNGNLIGTTVAGGSGGSVATAAAWCSADAERRDRARTSPAPEWFRAQKR